MYCSTCHKQCVVVHVKYADIIQMYGSPCHLLVSKGGWWRAKARDQLHWPFCQGLAEELVQVGRGQAAVPVLDNVAAVENLPKQVAKILPRYLRTAVGGALWRCMGRQAGRGRQTLMLLSR